MAENRVIGREGDLPWHLPADLAHFKRLTTGRTLVMGRRTFESIGQPLPNRRSIVLTRDPQWAHEGVEVVHDWDALQTKIAGEGEVLVIGGEAVFRQALPWVDRVYLTLVHATVAGDTYFPELPGEGWQLSADEHRPADERNKYAMSFQQYDRR